MRGFNIDTRGQGYKLEFRYKSNSGVLDIRELRREIND